MTTATIHQAKTHLSHYIKEIEKGNNQSLIIKRYNTPVARIIPYNVGKIKDNLIQKNSEKNPEKSRKKIKKRSAGMLKDSGFWIDDTFDESLEDEFDTPVFPA